MGGWAYSGFRTRILRCRRMRGCSSGVEGLFSSGAGNGLVERRRFPSNGALYLPHAYNFFNFFGRPRPDPVRPEDEPRPLAPNRADAYKFSPGGRSAR